MSNLTIGLSTDLKMTNQTSSPAIIARVQEDSNTAKAAYAQPLLALPSNTQPTVIAATTTVPLSLDAPTQDAWNLIAMQPDNLFPLSNQMAVVPLDCNQQPSSKCSNGITAYYNDITLTQTEATAMQQAFAFYQNVLAYPDTDLVKGFFELLSTYKNPDNALNLETTINQYFQQTQDYSQCTLASYIAVSTYCRHYAFAWANFQNRFTYLVFQPATDPEATVGLVSIGKILFSKQPNPPFPADVGDCNGGFSITYQPTVGSERKLSLVDGRLVSSDGSAPSVAFIFTYCLKSTFTQVETDTTAWPVLMGKIDGVQVVAVGDIPATPAKPNSTATSLGGNWHDDWVKLFNPKTTIDWVKVIGIVAAMAAGLGITAFMVYKTVQWIRIGRALSKLPTREEITAALEQIDEALKKFLPEEEIADKEAGIDGALEVDNPMYIEQCQNAVIARVDFSFQAQRTSFAESMQFYRKCIDTLAKYGINQDIREATGKLSNATELLRQSDTPTQLKEFQQAIKTDLATVDDCVKRVADTNPNLPRTERTEALNSEALAWGHLTAVDGYQEEMDLAERGESPIIDGL
jgi:hypothetical protein